MEKTVRKAFVVLERLASSPGPHRVTDLAEGAGLTKANVHRILATLVELGYVARDPATSRYSATLRLWEMGRRLVAENDLQSAAQPVMRALCEASGESVALGTFDAGFLVFVAQVEGPTAIRAVAQLGARFPATATSLGKAMLAFMPASALEAALPHVKPFTPTTLLHPTTIARDLQAARARGYAISRGEYTEEAFGIGCPIFDATGAVVAAVGVWGTEDRILGDRREALAARTMTAAAEISRRLGFVPGRVSAEDASPASKEKAAKPPARSPRRPPAAAPARPAARRERSSR